MTVEPEGLVKGDLIISADFGTSGVKVGVVDGDLNLLARVTETYPLALAPGGVAEQNPDDLWAALARALTALRLDIPELKDRVGALVFCAQIAGLICADAEGTPLRPCLTWLDKRAAGAGQRLIRGFPNIAGYRLDKAAQWLWLANGAPAKNGMDPIAKMLWVREAEPEIYARTRWFLDVRDWLVHRATGEFTANAESATLTWMLDSRTGREGWSPRLARVAGLDLDRMPPIVGAETVVGPLTGRAADELGLDPDVRVLAGTSDVTAAALGSGEVADGAVHISIATSAWIAGFFPGRRLSVAHAYATIASSLDFRPLLVASQENAGSALDWAVRMTGGGDEDLARAFDGLGPMRDDDPFFLPWLAGERVPVDDGRLRGTFHGLGLHHDRDALRRAALEGVALNMAWAFGKVMRERGARRNGPVALVGGAAVNPVLAQMLADALNREVRVGAARHAGVLGAATLAAPTMGWAESACAAAARLGARAGTRYAPDPDRVAQLATRAERLDAVRRDVIRSYRRRTGGTAGRPA